MIRRGTKEMTSVRKGFLITALGSLGWGVSGVCSQYLFEKYGVRSGWLTAVRMVFAGILLILMAARRGGKDVFAIFSNAAAIAQLLAFSIFGLLLCQFTFMSAIKYANSATATVLQSLNVVIMALLVSIHTKTRLSGNQIIAVLLAVLGTYLIASKGHVGSFSLNGLGFIMGLLSAVGVVSYTLISKSIIRKYGSIIVTGWGMLIGGAVASAYVRAWRIPSNFDLRAFFVIAVIVTLGTAVGFTAFLEGAKYIGPSKATLVGCLEPASATVFSMIFLGTSLGIAQGIGFCFIIATVFLSTRMSQKGVSD